MATPSSSTESAEQRASTGSPSNVDGDSMTDIPRRLMRVKVLYTFDDQNKSNCLARLPNALSIPTVALDETTQVGVIELKTCIQAIVAASPELVAKLGHDYTVYAFDYSEYETPLVGQGMLSWILASASSTPNAPAEQSQTMVTGRVCKNILGLFSNGIKETLEVKLKLVPVPTCMQSEYVENMERYHNLSKVLPEGLPDYNAWAQFLEANPAIRQLAQPTPVNPIMSIERGHMGGVESFHEMLTRPSPSEDAMRFDSFHDQSRMSFCTQDTRASSPAMSTASFYPYQLHPDSRPESRASFHSESAAYSQQYYPALDANQEQQEEGPPKKRARITKAKRPKKTALGANNDSLRVTASTAASVRLHRPASIQTGAAVSVEQVPRVPTPRPGNPTMPHSRAPLRAPAPSLLRHASMDESRPYISPYDSNLFSDAAIESADDERGGSPADTPLNLPSSPPLMPRRTASPARSSPDLPSLALPPLPPLPNDSGFVSDIPSGRDEEEVITNKPWDGSDLPTAPEVKQKKRPDNSKRPWTEVNSGPVELLPKSFIPKTKVYQRPLLQSVQENTRSHGESAVPIGPNVPIEEKPEKSFQGQVDQLSDPKTHERPNSSQQSSTSTEILPKTECVPFNQPPQGSLAASWPPSATNMNGPGETCELRASVPPKPIENAKARNLERSHTWSGEPMSDTAFPIEGNSRQPRSGSGAKRKHYIRERLEKALVAGEMPQYCNNCGQIDTPVWRKAYMRIENGVLEEVPLSSKGTSIMAIEPVESSEDGDGRPRYRIFKQALEPEEIELGTFTPLTLCNPCGLWLTKKNAMRPREVWAKAQANAADKPKRKRNRKKKSDNDDTMSDAILPPSETVVPEEGADLEVLTAGGCAVDIRNHPPLHKHSSGFEATGDSQLDQDVAQAALLRAIQSSPVGLRGSKNSPIEVESDLTPKPTRRLLFPSPRKAGEMKSLADSRPSGSSIARDSASKTTDPLLSLPVVDIEDTDKENCPPAAGDEDDGLSHLFEDCVSPKTTPTKGRTLEDLLQTPTPGSRRRNPLTPKRGDSIGLTTPSRIMKTPRTAIRSTTVAPETPFTRQLNALLSDCNLPTSPSQAIDFSIFPTFNTPGRNSSTNFGDLLSNDFLSSDLPIPSSPPGGLGFSVFEDPNTSTVGLWSGASIFERSDPVMSEQERRGSVDGAALRIDEISMDFAVLIEEVVGTTGNDEDEDGTGLVQGPDIQEKTSSVNGEGSVPDPGAKSDD